MGKFKEPVAVKLIIGILFRDRNQLKEIRNHLSKFYGDEETISGLILFSWTNYYADEIGKNLYRCFISYKNLIPREQMVKVKHQTNKLENKMSVFQKRTLNLDPGYMTLGQFFLMTTKDQSHRIYLGNYIFAEVTLYYKDGKFSGFPWTYRDYQSDVYHQYFTKVRSILAKQIKENNTHSLG